MLFNSYTFIAFLALVLVVHNLPLSWRLRKFNLLIASYLFYAAWNPPFVVLLWISTVVDWFCAKHMDRTSSERARRGTLILSLCVNLGLLGFFKYAGFFLGNFVALMHLMGVDFHPAAPDIILPVGISFYTFQTLSYTLDVYRRRARPWHSFLDYALYVTFFPQLVAGPIVRAVDFLPQTVEPKRTTPERLGWGLTLVLLGLFEKIVLSDGLLAPVAEQVFDRAASPGTLAAWTGTLAFSGQIFCDFAGYSTCAIGVAMSLGFDIPDNFRFPYAAIGFADFWRRWHISLSSWLRDYLYIPLGGNRKGTLRTHANLMTTMLLGGLWHGASWTFVVWGGLHGVYLVIERLLRGVGAGRAVWRKLPVRAALSLGTFTVVTFTWVFFRARTFGRAFLMSRAMLGTPATADGMSMRPWTALCTFAVVAAIVIVHWLMRERTLEELAERTPWALRAAAIAGMMAAIVLLSGEDRAFIYFQF